MPQDKTQGTAGPADDAKPQGEDSEGSSSSKPDNQKAIASLTSIITDITKEVCAPLFAYTQSRASYQGFKIGEQSLSPEAFTKIKANGEVNMLGLFTVDNQDMWVYRDQGRIIKNIGDFNDKKLTIEKIIIMNNLIYYIKKAEKTATTNLTEQVTTSSKEEILDKYTKTLRGRIAASCHLHTQLIGSSKAGYAGESLEKALTKIASNWALTPRLLNPVRPAAISITTYGVAVSKHATSNPLFSSAPAEQTDEPVEPEQPSSSTP